MLLLDMFDTILLCMIVSFYVFKSLYNYLWTRLLCYLFFFFYYCCYLFVFCVGGGRNSGFINGSTFLTINAVTSHTVGTRIKVIPSFGKVPSRP